MSGRRVRELAYFVAFGTYQALRWECTQKLSELYHRILVAHGIQRYFLEHYRKDYRISILDIHHFCATIITKLDRFENPDKHDRYIRIIQNVSLALMENHSEDLQGDFIG